MPVYTDGPIGAEADLSNLAPSLGASVGAAAEDAFIGNPSKVIYDYARVQSANSGARLDKATAEERVRSAGVPIKIPDSGYSEDALNMLIDRKREEITRKSVLDRAPAGIVPSTARFAASLLTSALDPLNVASAFIPVVGPARYAEMVAGAGGALGRFGVRAGVGAAEGAVGAAVVEPINYFGRTQMQDDYHMADSMANIAFGAVLGGALHGGAGAIGDRLGVSGFSRGDQVRAAEAGMSKAADAPLAEAGSRPQEVRPWFADQPVSVVPDAPFPKRWEVTTDSAKLTALDDLSPAFREELLAEAGARAEPGAVPAMREQVSALEQRVAQLETDAEFKQRARDFQTQGNSRKEAESLARKSIANDRADVEATQQRLNDTLDQNARASQAEQDIAKLDAGQAPERFQPQIEARAAQIVAAANIERAINGQTTPAQFVVGMADPAQRDAAMRAAIGQTMSGRMPDVEVMFRRSADPVGEATRVAERQASPETVAVADFPAARAADERLAAQPKPEDAAQASLDTHAERLDSLLSNLEQRGFAPERIEALRAELAPFDNAIADSKKLGDAMKAAAVCGLR